MSPLRPAAKQGNPFVGPRPLTSDDALYGRDREVERLLDQLVADRIVLLYSPSGAGKTSIIQAGLVPRLREDGFTVLPVPPARVGLEPSPDPKLPPHNRYQLSVLLCLERALPAEQQRPAAELTEMSLKRYLQRWPGQGDEGQSLVLLFDQFEELCTLDSTDLSAKAEFMTRLGSVLRDPGIWALFAMREEYVTMLDPYLARFPTRLSSTFRLDFLDQRAARTAIQQPVADLSQGVTFSDGAATKLVDDLRRVRVDRPDGSMRVLGPSVEPVQLQVVCRQLWEELPKTTKVITEKHIDAAGDIDRALSRYYEKQIRAVVAKTGVDEGDLRNWFNEKLITERGLRDQTSRGPGRGDKSTDRALEFLIDAHVIRAERRRDVTWYELAHDRLIEPIQDSNKWWSYENKGWLAYEAEEWDRHGRPADAPLHGALEQVESSSRRLAQQEPVARGDWVGSIVAGIWMSALIALVVFLAWLLAGPPPLDAQPVGVLALAAFAVWSLSFLPGWLYVSFLTRRASGLWDEYVLNLHRLGLDRPRHLPKPPVNSEFYIEWFDDGGVLLAHRQNIYRQKFDAFYGKSVSRIHERGRFQVRIVTLFPILVATATLAVCWTAVLWDPAFLTDPRSAWDVLKFGFLGAYVFVLYMLLRRYFRSDLRPNAYGAAALRIVVVLLLVAVLQQILPGNNVQTEAVVAFAIALFPIAGIQVLKRTVAAMLRVGVPSLNPAYPLNQIDGLSVWYEARLLEEGIEDMQGLATASLVDVILHSGVPVGRLVDWIDQAHLYLHMDRMERGSFERTSHGGGTNDMTDPIAQGSITSPMRAGARTRTALRQLGIRTATDLLKAFAQWGPDAAEKASETSAYRLAELERLGLDTEQIRSMVRVLSDDPSLVPVWNWQKRGLLRYPGQTLRSDPTYAGPGQ